MRISDWSSDVCSSDLPPPRRAGNREPPERGRDLLGLSSRSGGEAGAGSNPRGLLAVSSGPVNRGAGLSPLCDDCGRLAAGPELSRNCNANVVLARKSVVSGKSVTERVDLGGCSSIKKKKSNNNKN